jgi:hypothetical protein
MKRVLVGILLILGTAAMAGDNDTPQKIGVSIMRILKLDTTGTKAMSRTDAAWFARFGIAKCGAVMGVPFTSNVVSATGGRKVFVDSNLIAVQTVMYDSSVAGYFVPVRSLARMPADSMVTLSRDRTGAATVRDDYHATMYAHQWGSDSMTVGPVAIGADTFTVEGFRQARTPATDTSQTEIPQEWRQAAIFYGIYVASLSLANGRADEFYKAFMQEVADIWRMRGVPMSAASEGGK